MTSRSMVSTSMILLALPLVAHHRQAVYFDTTKLVTLKGVIAGVEWINPHSFLHLDVKGENGDVVRWLVEIPSPNSLTRQGVTKDSFKQGDEMTIGVWLAKDRSPRADVPEGGTFKTPSGQTVRVPFFVPSGKLIQFRSGSTK